MRVWWRSLQRPRCLRMREWEGLPTGSVHRINTITVVANSLTGSALETISDWPPSPLLNHSPIWKKILTLAAIWRLFVIGR